MESMDAFAGLTNVAFQSVLVAEGFTVTPIKPGPEEYCHCTGTLLRNSTVLLFGIADCKDRVE
jgi:hypothetical protein